MTPPTMLHVRLTRLLDVLQRVHDCKRTVAARLVGEACGLSPHTVGALATREYRHAAKRPDTYYDAPLSLLESKYRAALVAHAKYEAACRRAAA